MNQRRVDDRQFIPKVKTSDKSSQKDEASPEELIFAKAIEAEKVEEKIEFVKKLEKRKDEVQEAIKKAEDDSEKQRLKTMLENIDKRKDQLQENIEKQGKKNSDEPGE